MQSNGPLPQVIFHGTIVRLNRGLAVSHVSLPELCQEQQWAIASHGRCWKYWSCWYWNPVVCVCEQKLISMPQLCAYIPAILCEFSGIFNRFFRLDFLYFCRYFALSTAFGSTAFATSQPWALLMPTISTEHMTPAQPYFRDCLPRLMRMQIWYNSKMLNHAGPIGISHVISL
jgi:hypothetical protein